jgi:hypothetical protein
LAREGVCGKIYQFFIGRRRRRRRREWLTGDVGIPHLTWVVPCDPWCPW